MSMQAAFHRGVAPLLHQLLPGREEMVLGAIADQGLRSCIDALAEKNTEGNLTVEERAEYEGYVRANKFVAIFRREARRMKEAKV